MPISVFPIQHALRSLIPIHSGAPALQKLLREASGKRHISDVLKGCCASCPAQGPEDKIGSFLPFAFLRSTCVKVFI